MTFFSQGLWIWSLLITSICSLFTVCVNLHSTDCKLYETFLTCFNYREQWVETVSSPPKKGTFIWFSCYFLSKTSKLNKYQRIHVHVATFGVCWYKLCTSLKNFLDNEQENQARGTYMYLYAMMIIVWHSMTVDKFLNICFYLSKLNILQRYRLWIRWKSK